MNIKSTIIIILLISCSILSSCGRYGNNKKMENLEQSITSYEVALRWALYEEAYRYHVSEDGEKPEFDLDSLQDIKVSGIDITNRIVNKDKNEAHVKGVVRYFNRNTGTERKIKLEQKWWYDEDRKQWFIDSEYPELK